MLTTLLVKKKALEAGFDLVGIAPADTFDNAPVDTPPGAPNDLKFAREWWEKGYGGEMRYLANPKRYDPKRVLPDARSLISVALIYNTPLLRSVDVVQGKDSHGWVSRYAWGEDYHRILKRKLQALCRALSETAPGAALLPYVDTGPVVERAFARLSGIGWMGKNTCLINTGKGSWFFLGAILTDLDLEPDTPAPDRCGSCRRCLDACPTDAFVAPYVMDASRCISYFTIELRGGIPEPLRESMGNHVFGCDICQDVCPWNRKAATASPTASENAFLPLPLRAAAPSPDEPETLFHPSLDTLASLREGDFNRLFRLSPLKRTKFRGWLRNLSIAMGNSGDRKFIPWLERLATDEDAMLGEHARWAIGRLRRTPTSNTNVLSKVTKGL